jgi:hypothetical protein
MDRRPVADTGLAGRRSLGDPWVLRKVFLRHLLSEDGGLAGVLHLIKGKGFSLSVTDPSRITVTSGTLGWQWSR